MNRDDVERLMESSRSAKEWNDNCDKVKAAHRGNYPEFWFASIVVSGLSRRVAAGWGGSAYIRVIGLSA